MFIRELEFAFGDGCFELGAPEAVMIENGKSDGVYYGVVKTKKTKYNVKIHIADDVPAIIKGVYSEDGRKKSRKMLQKLKREIEDERKNGNERLKRLKKCKKLAYFFFGMLIFVTAVIVLDNILRICFGGANLVSFCLVFSGILALREYCLMRNEIKWIPIKKENSRPEFSIK